MEKASEAMYGNFYEAPWQPVREGIGRVVFAGAHAKGCTLLSQSVRMATLCVLTRTPMPSWPSSCGASATTMWTASPTA